MAIEAKPQDIPGEIEADVSELGIGDQLRVSDLTLPAGVTTNVEPETLVVHVAAPRGLGAEEGEGEAGEGAEGAAAAEAGETSEGGGE